MPRFRLSIGFPGADVEEDVDVPGWNDMTYDERVAALLAWADNYIETSFDDEC